jgi:hypothetical protein
VQYRALKPVEVDFHLGRRQPGTGSYDDAMGEIHRAIADAVRTAQQNGAEWLMAIHGVSTSGPGKTTTRSVIRGFMRSAEATPYIVRKDCTQHETVFVAKIRPKTGEATV